MHTWMCATHHSIRRCEVCEWPNHKLKAYYKYFQHGTLNRRSDQSQKVQDSSHLWTHYCFHQCLESQRAHMNTFCYTGQASSACGTCGSGDMHKVPEKNLWTPKNSSAMAYQDFSSFFHSESKLETFLKSHLILHRNCLRTKTIKFHDCLHETKRRQNCSSSHKKHKQWYRNQLDFATTLIPN